MKTSVTIAITAALLLAAYTLSDGNTKTGEEGTPEAATITVAESINAGGYTYIRYRQDGTDVWVATRQMQVGKGDDINHPDGMEMRDFHSKALDRTFERIRFVDGVQRVRAVAPESLIEAAHGAQQKASASALPPSPAAGEIQPLEEGKTISQLLDGYPEHTGQQARIRARVIKVSENIMGKNWVTLEDGTGKVPNNKLIATTQEDVNPGDTVVVSGVIANDVSLGYGYDYKVLLEEARFTVQ